MGKSFQPPRPTSYLLPPQTDGDLARLEGMRLRGEFSSSAQPSGEIQRRNDFLRTTKGTIHRIGLDGQRQPIH